MKFNLILSLWFLKILYSSENPNSLSKKALYCKKIDQSFFIESFKIRTLSDCLYLLQLNLENSSKFSKILDIILINLIKSRKTITFQLQFFFNLSLRKKKNFFKFVYKHLKNELNNKDKNEINKKVLNCLFVRNFNCKSNLSDQINLEETDFSGKMIESIDQFNNFVKEYVVFIEYKLINQMKNYLQDCRWKINLKTKWVEKKYDHSFFSDTFTKKILLDLYKFFPDLKLVLTIILDSNYKKSTLKKIHFVFSFIFLAVNSLTEILFYNKKEIFKNKFIPKYKLIILKNCLMEQYLFLSISTRSIRLKGNLVVYLLFKFFILFCKVNDLYCPIEFKKISFDFYNDKKLDLKIITKVYRFRHDTKMKSDKKYLLFKSINCDCFNL